MWSRASGYLAQLDPAVRSILVALGLQQRVLSKCDSDRVADSELHCSNTSYVKALRSYRRHLLADGTANEATRLFGCLLFVMLESLRGSHAEMLMHLTNGARLISAASVRFWDSDEIQDMAMLMQQFCMSSWLYCNSELFSETLQPLTIQTVVEGYADLETHQLRKAAFDLCGIVRDTISCFGKINRDPKFCTETVSGFGPVDCLYHLQQRQQELAQRLSICQMHGLSQSATFHFLSAGSTLSRIYLKAKIEMREINNDGDSRSFRSLLSHIEEGLHRLKHDITNPSDGCTIFSTGTGVIHLLESTTRNCKDQELRRRAVDLLDHCPEREGMWSASRAEAIMMNLII